MRTHVAVAAAAAVCLLVGGCGSLRAGGGPATVPTGPAGAGSPASTAAANRELATKEALHLLSLVQVPDRAVQLKSAPQSLIGPALGTPMVSSLIDRTRSWRVAMPFALTIAWLRAHRPHGLHQYGSMTGQDPDGTTVTGDGYHGPDSAAWASAELDIEAAPVSQGASVIRADGIVTWLDPSPRRDTAPGLRMRVAVADGCPDSDARVVGVINRGTDLAHRLLPNARPTAGLECRYYGINGHAWQLRSATRLTAAAAAHAANSMARLPLSHPDGAVTNCPAADGAAEVIALSYPHRADVDVWIWLTRCGGGRSNGHIMTG